MIKYGWPRPAPRTLAERIAEMTEAARYLHGDLLDLAADLDAAEGDVEPDTRPDTEDLPGVPLGQSIDLADLRPGDVFEARHQHRVVADGDRVYTGTTTYYLLERPDPDAALHAAIEDAWAASEVFDPSEFVAALAAAGYVIEPAPKAES